MTFECPNEHTVNREPGPPREHYWITCGDRVLDRFTVTSDSAQFFVPWRDNTLSHHRIEVKDAEIERLRARERDLLDHIDTLTALAYEDHQEFEHSGECALCDEPAPCQERLLIDRVRAAVRSTATTTEEETMP